MADLNQNQAAGRDMSSQDFDAQRDKDMKGGGMDSGAGTSGKADPGRTSGEGRRNQQ
jgi:hypothetical protein